MYPCVRNPNQLMSVVQTEYKKLSVSECLTKDGSVVCFTFNPSTWILSD